MRIDRRVAQATDLSRKQVHIALKQGRVSVNGQPVTQAACQVQPEDRITLDDEPLTLPGKRYFMLHKPAGYLCATEDAHHPTVLDLLNEPNKQQLQLVGRLDLDTTGLLLITDDGQWNHRITSPNSRCEKTYVASLAEPLAADVPARFAQGIVLRSEAKPTLPAKIEALTNNRCRITLAEGRYHQVKRMLAAVNNRVLTLHRERIGQIALDSTLACGQYRPLTQAEINSIQ